MTTTALAVLLAALLAALVLGSQSRGSCTADRAESAGLLASAILTQAAGSAFDSDRRSEVAIWIGGRRVAVCRAFAVLGEDAPEYALGAAA